MKAPTGDAAFDTEVLKLLLQVAWADDELDPAEKELIHTLGRTWSVPAAVLDDLMQRLAHGKPLPQPDMARLRTRPTEVLEAARALAGTDGRIAEQEADMIAQIAGLLGVAP